MQKAMSYTFNLCNFILMQHLEFIQLYFHINFEIINYFAKYICFLVRYHIYSI